MNDIKPLDECLCCGNKNLNLLLDLKKQPLANSFKATAIDMEAEYPLAVNYCPECHHLQLTHAVSPEIMFKNYLYVSGTSQTMHDYMDWFADFVCESYSIGLENVLEIGCNDGTQLNYFKSKGVNTVGIDPAENIYPISSKNHEIICDFFNADSLLKIKNTPDVIYAQNVFAHQDNPLEFLKLCRLIMTEDTLLIIQNSQSDWILNNEFDTIYHEHRNFFCLNSMKALAERAGLYIQDVFTGVIHGGSDIYFFSKSDFYPHRVAGLLAREKQRGLHNPETYKNWANNTRRTVSDLSMVLDGQRKGHNRLLVGYGAPAKGNTLLNFGKIQLDFIIDDNPLKQGKFTPGMSIPVVAPDYLDQFVGREICFVPLAWNFYSEIRNRIKSRRDNGGDVFVKYFPKIQVSS